MLVCECASVPGKSEDALKELVLSYYVDSRVAKLVASTASRQPLTGFSTLPLFLSLSYK